MGVTTFGDAAAEASGRNSRYEQGRNDGIEDAARQVEGILRGNDGTLFAKLPKKYPQPQTR